jgi:RHS repeat-associated protein
VLEACQRATARASWASSLGARPEQVSIDPNGNLTQKTEGTDTWVYTWNAENQLTKVEKNGTEVARFTYDPRGRRVEKVAGGVTAGYTYDIDDILRERRGATIVSYVYGPGFDDPVATEDGTVVSYFHADGLGSIVKTSDVNGQVALSRQYDAWGSLQVGASEPGYAFTGREWDPETQLYYYRARYYDPAQGRFISEDPIGFSGGLNFFGYVGNGPTNRIDPLGLKDEPRDPPGCRGGEPCKNGEQETADAMCRKVMADPKAPDCIKRQCPTRVRCNRDPETCNHNEPGTRRPVAHGAASHGPNDVHLCRGEKSCAAILHELVEWCGYGDEQGAQNAERIFGKRYCGGI